MHSNVVYPLLKKFMQNGWVEQSSMQGDRGQTRKQYRITTAGRSNLLEQLGSAERYAGDDGSFLFVVAVFDVLPNQKRFAILAARKSFLVSRSQQLSELRVATQPISFGAVALERVERLIQDELRWIQQLERKLENKKGDLKCTQLRTPRATAHRS